MKKAIYAGSFDPLTNGHTWIIEQASKIFDELTVAIGVNPSKKYFFTKEERLTLIKQSLSDLEIKCQVKMTVIENKFLVKYAQEKGIQHLVRGIRSEDDFNYEFAMNQINRDIAPKTEAIYLIPPHSLTTVSSSMVKGLVGIEDWKETVSKYVNPFVLSALKEKLTHNQHN